MSRAGCYQGDIITAIAAGQPSRNTRSSHLPYSVPLASEPIEMKASSRKRDLGLEPGTVFAQRGPDKGPRPRRLAYGLCLCPRPQPRSTEKTVCAAWDTVTAAAHRQRPSWQAEVYSSGCAPQWSWHDPRDEERNDAHRILL